jgi:formylglycine-generating enzyme required for sulfatase activity
MNARELIEEYKAGRRNFKNLDLSGIDLSWAKLSDIDVQGSDLEKARFRGATLVKANFSGSNLKHSDLSEANLAQVNLCGADLRGVNLRGMTWSSPNYNSDTKFPFGFKPEDCDNYDQLEPLENKKSIKNTPDSKGQDSAPTQKNQKSSQSPVNASPSDQSKSNLTELPPLTPKHTQVKPLETKPLEKNTPDSKRQDSAPTQKNQKSSQPPVKVSPSNNNNFRTAASAKSGAVSSISSGTTNTLSPAINVVASSSETLQSKSNLTELPSSTPNHKQVLKLEIPGARPLELLEIPAGSFLMGSKERDSEQPIHKVTIQAFRIGKYPVTQGQYEAVRGKNPSYFTGADCPVENVSWHDAVEFCQKLSQMTGQRVSLPSEAQWEYACRAGSAGKYCFGDDVSKLGNYAWFLFNSSRQTHPVGQKNPNGWGVYDMHGNVWEWCADAWHANYRGAPANEIVWDSTEKNMSRVLRGGSWYYNPGYCRSATRNKDQPGYGLNNVGFRVVCIAL